MGTDTEINPTGSPARSRESDSPSKARRGPCAEHARPWWSTHSTWSRIQPCTPHVHTRAHARIHRHTPHRGLAPTCTHAGTHVSYADWSDAHTPSHICTFTPLTQTDLTCIHVYTPQCGLSPRTHIRISTPVCTQTHSTHRLMHSVWGRWGGGHGGEAVQGGRTKQPRAAGGEWPPGSAAPRLPGLLNF